jgi:hypothetical protein
MSIITEFEARLPAAPRGKFQRLQRPIDIQRYLDSIPYVGEERDRCPLDVMKDEQCHCLDGGLFAALALRRIGDPGLLIDLVPAKDSKGRKLDDDHVLAVYRRHGLWGAVAKSNFPWLRYREPAYRNVRELVMSYFEVYYSVDAIKALRGYTRPFDISRHDRLDYAWDEGGAALLYKRFYSRTEIPLIPPEAEALLEPVDQRAYDSGILGVNWDWVYRPQDGPTSAKKEPRD